MVKSKFTKLLCLVLSLVMILGAAPVAAFSANSSLSGFSGGDGTQANPYRISSKTELENLANIVNGGNNCADTCFVLSDNIGTETEPVTTFIGNNDNPFGGHFDGAGFTVTLNIDVPVVELQAVLEDLGIYLHDGELEMFQHELEMAQRYPEDADRFLEHFLMDAPGLTTEQLIEATKPEPPVGLFGYLLSDGEIKDVTTAGSVSGGEVGGVCGINYGTITGCHNTAAVSGQKDVGGICGSNYGIITFSYNTADVTGQGCIGGVCGHGIYSSALLKSCYNSGSVSGSGMVGGICGRAHDGFSIYNSYNTGTVTGAGQVGGICGHIYCTTVCNSYNTGEIIGSDDSTGGLCGYSTFDLFFCNSYSSGKVTANGNPGGLYTGVANYPCCYYNADIYAATAYGIELSTKQMQAASGTEGALVDLLNGYITDNSDTTADWCVWDVKPGEYPEFLVTYVYTAEDNILKASADDICRSVYTLTLTENGTISAEEVTAWHNAGLTLPEIVFDTDENTASITAGDATATVMLADDALQARSIKVICGADENGKSYITDVMPGTAVTVTAGKYEGKLFEKWIAGLGVNGSTAETVTFTMPNEDVTLEAEFVDCYALSVFDGTTLTSAPQKVNYTATVNVPATPEGTRFTGWTAEGLTLTDSMASVLEFAMPANAVMLTANFISPNTVTVEGGTITNAGTSGKVFAGDTVTVTADADTDDARFTQWSSTADITFADKTAKTTTFTMPAADVIISAQKEQSHTVNVSGGTASGVNNAGKAFPGDTVTITADADTNDFRFTQWSSEGITLADKTAKTFTFTMPDAAVFFTANKEQSYTVTVTDGTASGGTGSVKAFAGQTVTVTANNISGHKFTGWTGEGVEFADAASTTTTFTMPGADVTVKANYEQITVAYPTAGTKSYTYNGTAQTYEFAADGDASCYTLQNNTQTDAGTYTVKAHLIDGAVWTDGTTADKEFTFVIARQPIDKPLAYNTQYYYNGAEQSFILCKQVGASYYYYESTVPAGSFTVRGGTRTDAGSQGVMVTPTSNYCWKDGTRDSVIFGFTINKYPVPVLFSDPHTFTYNGKAQKYTPFVSKNGKLYDFDGLYYDLSNRTQTAAGNYTVTATLRDNFCWYDGSTAPRNFTFKISPKEINSHIYYVEELSTGKITANVDISYTEYDNISCLKGFSKHPKFKEDMLKDRYMPVLRNAPDGAEATFYLTESNVTPAPDELYNCLRWDYVKMSDLKPNTIYYVFAVVSCEGYEFAQITEVSDLTCFRTSDLPCKLVTAERVTETELNEEYQMNVISCIFEGGMNSILNTFSTKMVSKSTNLAVKTEYYSDLDAAILQATKDIDEGLDYAVVGFEFEGKPVFYDMTADNVAKYKGVLNKKGYSLSAPKKMLAASADEPAAVEITGISGEPAEFTPELINSMFDSAQIESLLLDSVEFKVAIDPELAAAQTADKNAALVESLEADDLIAAANAPDYFTSTVTVSSILYDPQTGCVDGESNEYVLEAGALLPANAVREIEGYTFEGLFYREIMGFEKDSKPAEATGDHGMILTQGLVKWDPETDYITRDTDLMAIYVKNGAEEPVGYLTSGTAFTGAGSEAVVTLPAIPEGMTYGSVVNNNENITVSAVSDGKVTVTAVNELSGTEPITFTVGVNANTEGIEDPFYYILVTINTVDEDDAKEEAQAFIEALADDAASDEVLAIISDAVAALEDADSYDAVNAIKAKAVEDVAAQILNEAKTEAIDAVNEAAGANPSSELAIVLAYAAMAINNADSINAVEAEMQNALAVIAKLSDDYTYSTEWSTNATHHWHEANGNHPGYVSDYAEHTFGDDGKCTACGYEKQAGEKKYTVVLTGLSNPAKNYSGATDDNGICNIENIENGTYLMAISCEGAVTRTYTTEITDGTISQDIELYDDGDVNGDGEITVEDYSAAVNAALAGDNEVPEDLSLDADYSKAVADCDGDGVVDVLDVAMLERKIFA